jgi:phytoene dehydrogenase-like protein
MKDALIIGAGINGLVAANYLQRQGFRVTVLERKAAVGGACATALVKVNGREYIYSNGASVLGLMQDFVFEETGLAKCVSVFAPQHPPIVYFESDSRTTVFHDDVHVLKSELRDKWNEQGDIESFVSDREKIRRFLIDGFKSARVPTIGEANLTLGKKLTQLWIEGSARKLFSHYFTSDKTKMFFVIEVTESGPVPFDSPYSAFNVALMSSGTIFDGNWGFVKGGIWQIAESLRRINIELGAKLITEAEVSSVACSDGKVAVSYKGNRREEKLTADLLIFATEPLSASRLIGDRDLEMQISNKKLLGTSGKVVLFFKDAVKWIDPTGSNDFDSAFRFIIATKSPDQFEDSSRLVESLSLDYSPAYFEIYCEGAGRRKLGEKLDYDLVAVFFKNLAFAKTGIELPDVLKQVEQVVLSKIENRDAFVHSLLITPKDIRETFFMPEGNIDHIELCDGQNFFQRNFSPDPEQNFYQFGKNENVYYCGAGSYPCGSVAGTPGYMCAQDLIRRYG